MKKITSKLALIVTGTLFLGQIALAEDTARDLFFNPTKAIFGGAGSAATVSSNSKIGQNFDKTDNDNLGGITGYYDKLENPGVQYSIELLRMGTNTTKRVDGNHIFKTGDKIRVHVTSNANGYMHALHKGSTGDELLIPVSANGQVQNGQDVTIPSATGWLRFDQNKGVELLDLVFASHSSAAQEGIVPTINNRDSLVTAVRHVADTYSMSKDLKTYVLSGTKDLVIEGGSNGGAYPTTGPVNRTNRTIQQISQDVYNAPANYAVNIAGKPVAIKISLKHQ